MKHLLSLLTVALVFSLAPCPSRAETLAEPPVGPVLTDIPYKTGAELSDYEKERCKLDVHLPAVPKGFATLVWFHGGGLQEGDKRGDKANAISFAKGGIAFVSPNYRLSPKAKFPSYLEDAAAAVAWTRAHIAEHGGDPAKVFVGGHSAGGYIALMVGLDERYLRANGLAPADLAGLVPMSGQTMTHYTVREERGIGKYTITADGAAPVFHVRKDTPPMLVLYADHDMAARAEENEYLVAILKGAGNTRVTGRLITDRTHGTIASQMENENDPARLTILEFLRAPTK